MSESQVEREHPVTPLELLRIRSPRPLLVRLGYTDSDELAQPQQTRQPLGGTPARLHPVAHLWILDAAATVHAIPAARHARASPYPVEPASYATRTGARSACSHPTVSTGRGGTRKLRSS